MNHPILPVSGEEYVATRYSLAVEYDHYLCVVPLFDVKFALIPDADQPSSVLTGGDLSFERPVFERVILGVHGEMIRFGIHGHSFGKCP
jgi:hypothetical protein